MLKLYFRIYLGLNFFAILVVILAKPVTNPMGNKNIERMNVMDTEKLMEILPLLVPIVIIQLSLQVYSMVNLVKRNKVRFNSKLLWGVIIILGSILGSTAYLVFRGDEE